MRTETKAWDAMGDPTRRKIVEILRGGPTPVGVIAEQLPVSRPAVSKHLRFLLAAGLVAARRDGTKRLYALEREGLSALRNELDELWSVALDRFREEAER